MSDIRLKGSFELVDTDLEAVSGGDIEPAYYNIGGSALSETVSNNGTGTGQNGCERGTMIETTSSKGYCTAREM